VLIPSSEGDNRTPTRGVATIRDGASVRSRTDMSNANSAGAHSVTSHRSRSSVASNYSDASGFVHAAMSSRSRRTARSHRGAKTRRVAEKTADGTRRRQEAWEDEDRRAKAKLYRSRNRDGSESGIETVLPATPNMRPDQKSMGPLVDRMMNAQIEHRHLQDPAETVAAARASNPYCDIDPESQTVESVANVQGDASSVRGRGRTRGSDKSARASRRELSPPVKNRTSKHSDVQNVAASVVSNLKAPAASSITPSVDVEAAMFEKGKNAKDGDFHTNDQEHQPTVCCGPYALWHPSVMKEMLFDLLDVADFDDEAVRIFKLGIPYTASAVVESFLELVYVVLISRYLGVESVTAALMVDILIGSTTEFLNGVVDAATSITSHAIGGGNNFLAGQYVQQSMVMYTLGNIPMFFMWWFLTEPAIQWFGLSDNVASLGRDYARVAMFHEWQDGVTNCLHGLYEVTDHEIFSAVISFIENVIGVCVIGAAVVLLPDVQLTTLAWLNLIVGGTFTVISLVIPLKMNWLKPYVGGLFCSCALSNTKALWTLLTTAFPISVGELIAYGEWEILTVFSAHLGPAEISAWALLGSVWDLFEVSTQGLGDAAEVRVGYHLGGGRPEMARKSCFQCLFWGSMLGVLVSSIFFCVGDSLPKILTNDPFLQHMISDLFPFVGIGNISMTFGMVAWALIGAQGRYGLATKIATVLSWLVTVPLAAYFIYAKRYDLKGLVAAVVMGYSVMGTCMSYVLMRSDWETLSENIMELNAITGEVYSSDEEEESDDDSSSKSSSSSSSSSDSDSNVVKPKFKKVV
jgi:MATE family multidrug resistance protein